MFMDLLLPPAAWARRHFSGVDLGDARRNHRAITIAAAMAQRPGASIPRQMGRRHQAKAAYRFFDTPDVVTFQALAQHHWEQTRRQMAALPVVLLVQDGTEIDYSGHRQVEGLEPIGDGRGRGMLLHSVLAIDGKGEDAGQDAGRGAGQVQGLAWQDLRYRQTREKTETRTQRHRRTDRESAIWARSVHACGRPPAGKRWVHVCDCGADDFGFYQAAREVGCDFLSRICQQRRAALGHEAQKHEGLLIDLARTLPALGGKTLKLRSRTGVIKRVKRPGQKGKGSNRRLDVPGREAKLLVSAGAVSVFAPWLNAKAEGHDDAGPLRLWVVRVWEVDPPAGVEPIEWVLLSSMPVRNLSEALQMARWYSCRWMIEEYHKCLKSGCGVERRQLEHADRLEAMLGVMVVVAVRLLALKQQTLDRPDSPAAAHVGPLTVRLLIGQRGLPASAVNMTVYQFWREVAQLGGFLARRSDGEPGWQTLWNGWQELQLMVRGAELLMANNNSERSG